MNSVYLVAICTMLVCRYCIHNNIQMRDCRVLTEARRRRVRIMKCKRLYFYTYDW